MSKKFFKNFGTKCFCLIFALQLKKGYELVDQLVEHPDFYRESSE